MSEAKGFQVEACDRKGQVHDERWTADAITAAGILDDLRDDPYVAEGWIENGDGTRFDPEMLPPVEKIRYAAWLIRRQHKVLDDDWMFWREIADHLNGAANIPDKDPTARQWREFNRAQDMAVGYIRMSAAREAVRS